MNASGPIAIVAHTHPSVTKGGGEIAAYALYEGLCAIGVDAIFIAVCPAQDRPRLVLGSAREFALFSEPQRYDHFYHLSAPDIWRQLKAILLAQHVRLVNFQHFLSVGINALRALRAETDIDFAVTFHEFVAICNNNGQMVTRPARRLCEAASPIACIACFPEHTRPQFEIRKHLIQSALAPAGLFISPSHFLAERMIAWGLPAEKFAVIENGLRQLPPPDRRRREHRRGQPWVFGFFGQLTPYKGGDTLLDAIELLASQPERARRVHIRLHGTIVGQSAEFTARFNDVVARHDFVTCAGPYENADVFTLMGACDYTLMASTWWENSPVVIQEAYAAGRPVVCPGIGGMAEKVPDHRAGLHFRPGDAADLVRVLGEAADDALYTALSAGVPAASNREAMARAYLAAFAGSAHAGEMLPGLAAATLPESPRTARRRGRLPNPTEFSQAVTTH